MNMDINTLLKQQFLPVLSIVVYQLGEEREYGNNEYYLESHNINTAGQLEEGKPLMLETISGIVEAFKDKHQRESRISGAIPACLLNYSPGAAGEYTIIWHRPSAQRPLHFIPELKLKSGPAMVPPMLFMATASHLRVWALANGKRPGPKSKIWPAPFHNVNDTGRVCLGSAKARVPAVKTFENLIAYWEEMFWGSKFSAVHNDKAVKGGLQKLWRSQLARPDRPFPLELLPETKTTYQSIINGR